METQSLKIAIVHDWLVTYAGAERVLEQMLHVYPNADMFAVVDFLEDHQRGFLLGKKAQTSFVQKLPFAKTKYRHYLPVMPFAVEQFDLSCYDIIISSSHAVAKGVLTGPDQLHVCMCYSPIRYAWDLQHQYLREAGKERGIMSVIMRYLLHKMRIWDARTANGVDEFIAISKFIERRIKKTYNRPSEVIYPPVYVEDFDVDTESEKDYYVTFSRMVPYKKIDLIAETFTKRFPDKKLIVIGDGPQFNMIKEKSGPNVSLLGHADFPTLKKTVAKARAFIFASEEDFGIAPLEAQAAGVPVIAYGKGGAVETVIGLDQDNPTGVFFQAQTVDSLSAAVTEFETQEHRITTDACLKNAQRFNKERFKQEFLTFVEAQYLKRKNQR